MKCRQIKEHISLYIDNQLDEDTKYKIEEHLKTCYNCRAYYEELLENINLLKDLPNVDLPKDFHKDLHEALIENTCKDIKRPLKKTKSLYKKRSLKKMIAIAAMLMVMIVSISIKGNTSNRNLPKNQPQHIPQPVAFSMESDESSIPNHKPQMRSVKNFKSSQEMILELEVNNIQQQIEEISKLMTNKGTILKESDLKEDNNYLYKELTIHLSTQIFEKMIEEFKKMGEVKNTNISICMGENEKYKEDENHLKPIEYKDIKVKLTQKKTNALKIKP